MKKIEINHFLDFKFPSAPTFSPDGKTIAFVVRQASLEKNAYPGDLWLLDVETKALRQHHACLRHGLHRPGLSYHLFCKLRLQFQQLFPLRGGQPPQRDPCPFGYHPGNIRPGDAVAPLSLRGFCGQPLHPVPQLGRLLKAAFPDSRVKFLFQRFPGIIVPGGIHSLQTAAGTCSILL